MDSIKFDEVDNTIILNNMYANLSLFMKKKLNKAVMVRSRLRNKFFRNISELTEKAYNKQRNYVVSLLRKSNREYYNGLYIKTVIDNKKIWKTIKPLFSNKLTSNNKIILIENIKKMKLLKH